MRMLGNVNSFLTHSNSLNCEKDRKKGRFFHYNNIYNNINRILNILKNTLFDSESESDVDVDVVVVVVVAP